MSETEWGTSKTTPGLTLTRVEDLEEAVHTGSWLIFLGRPYHPRFVTNMNFMMVLGRLRRGQIAWAMRKEDPSKHYRSEADRARSFQAPVTRRMESVR